MPQCRIAVALQPTALLLPRYHRPGFDFDQHFLEIDADSPQERRRARMRAKIGLELLEELVHLVAHVEHIFATRQVVTEHDDVLERRVHHFKLVLDVLERLANLLLDVHRHDLALAVALILGRAAWHVFERVAARFAGKEQDVDVPFRLETAAPVHLLLVIVRPKSAPLVFDLTLLCELNCLGIRSHCEHLRLGLLLPFVRAHSWRWLQSEKPAGGARHSRLGRPIQPPTVAAQVLTEYSVNAMGAALLRAWKVPVRPSLDLSARASPRCCTAC